MSVEKIIKGMEDSPLSRDIKDKAIEGVREISSHLAEMFRGLHFKPPSVHAEWYEEITCEVIGHITSVLQENGVSENDGQATYRAVYKAISS
jgi:hypothetical protein